MYRRSASRRSRNTGNSHVAEPHIYDLSSDVNSHYTLPEVYSQVRAPAAGSTNATKPSVNGVTQPSAPPLRSSSLYDVTLVDNDLYH